MTLIQIQAVGIGCSQEVGSCPAKSSGQLAFPQLVPSPLLSQQQCISLQAVCTMVMSSARPSSRCSNVAGMQGSLHLRYKYERQAGSLGHFNLTQLADMKLFQVKWKQAPVSCEVKQTLMIRFPSFPHCFASWLQPPPCRFSPRHLFSLSRGSRWSQPWLILAKFRCRSPMSPKHLPTGPECCGTGACCKPAALWWPPPLQGARRLPWGESPP